MADLVSYPAGLAAAIQEGFLYSEFLAGLSGQQAFAREAVPEDIPAAIGQSITLTRHGKIKPSAQPRTASSINSNRDNGLTPVEFSIEQYTIELFNYAQTADVNIFQQTAGVQKQSTVKAKLIGEAAFRTKEWVARNELLRAYMGGNSRVRADIQSSTTTTCRVDDARGFDTKVKDGKPQAVSGSNKLAVQEINPTTGAVVQTLQVTGCSFHYTTYEDQNNTSTAKVTGGITGTLTFDSANAPTDGNILIAENAARMYRPNGKRGTVQLSAQDNLSNGGWAMLLNVKARLAANGVPPHESGLYHCILDDLALAQLQLDPDFKNTITGRIDSDAVRKGQVFVYAGMLFIPTTEMPIQPANTSLGVNVETRRVLVTGAECLVEGNYLGIEAWAQEAAKSPIHDIFIEDNVALITAPLNDRLGQLWGISYHWPGGYKCPTDVTADTDAIPTADGKAQFKRAAVLEFAA